MEKSSIDNHIEVELVELSFRILSIVSCRYRTKVERLAILTGNVSLKMPRSLHGSNGIRG